MPQGHNHRKCPMKSCWKFSELMVARDTIELRTRGFSVIFRRFQGLINQPLAALPAPSPASPRHNHGTPNLSSTHSWHTGGNLDLYGAASLMNGIHEYLDQVRHRQAIDLLPKIT